MIINKALAGHWYLMKLKQISKIIGYCSKHNIDPEHITFKDFLILNDRFDKYDWFSLSYIEHIKKYKSFNLIKIQETNRDKYLKLKQREND